MSPYRGEVWRSRFALAATRRWVVRAYTFQAIVMVAAAIERSAAWVLLEEHACGWAWLRGVEAGGWLLSAISALWLRRIYRRRP